MQTFVIIFLCLRVFWHNISLKLDAQYTSAARCLHTALNHYVETCYSPEPAVCKKCNDHFVNNELLDL